MNKNTLLLIMMLFCASPLIWGQTENLGEPRSWSPKLATKAAPLHQMPGFDLQAQLQADAINEANKVGPWRFGYEYPVNYGLNNAGQWTTLPSGDRIWRIAFEAPGALSMNLIFDQFVLPQGATVYVYDQLKQHYLGAYTHKNNNDDQMLGTSLINGDNIVVEYYEPAAVRGKGKLNVGTVIHGYKSLSLYEQNLRKALNSSGDCNLDVKCNLGIGWEDQINSVGIIMSGGSGACTGALINNTAQDGTPYFLTANHCLGGSPGSWVFRFNWDSPVAVCASTANSQDPGAPYNEINGAVVRANDSGSDFALLELNSTPTSGIYYAGWSRSTTPATEATAIHHPRGDVKKISRENNTLSAQTWSGAQTWQVADWDQGTTEPGSSGSPLFDQNQRIIGQLYGGTAACSGLSNNGSPDYYGRFDVSWTGGGTSSTRLSNWLDPSGSNVTTLDGYPNSAPLALDAGISNVNNMEGTFCNQSSFTPEVTLRNYGSATLTSAVIEYDIDGGAATTYNWSGSLATNSVTNVTLPAVTIGSSGAHTFNVTVSTPNGQLDSNTVNDVGSSNFNVVLNGASADLELNMDCFGSEISWSILDGGTPLYTSNSYQDVSGGETINESFCLSAGCYTFRITDSYGDGLNGSQWSFCSVDGSYYITDNNGDTLVQIGAVDFGTGSDHNFCISAPANVNTIAESLQNLQIFPNPNDGEFTIQLKLNRAEPVDVQVYNAVGQQLRAIHNEGQLNYSYPIDIKDQSAGMYIVRVVVGNEVITRKLIKK